MKASFVAAAIALAAPVFAQSPLESLPECAAPCLISNLSKAGCANITDFECVCASEAFVTAAATCIIASCEGDDQSNAIQGAYQLCLANGVTIPTVFPGQEGEASSTSAAPVESSTAPAEETVTEAPTDEPTEVPEVTSTFTTVVGTGSGPVPTNGTNTQPPVPTATEGAATRMGVSFGALGLAIAGFVAL